MQLLCAIVQLDRCLVTECSQLRRALHYLTSQTALQLVWDALTCPGSWPLKVGKPTLLPRRPVQTLQIV